MRILVIDDNALTVDLLTTYLSLEGHEVRFEGDGLAALTYLDAPGIPLPHVFILDLKMPGMDGEEFLENLKQKPEWERIPVILSTATSLSEQSHVRQRYPRLRTLPKPYEPNALLDVLKEIDEGAHAK